MEITSDKVTVNYAPETVFNFISDFNNFKSLLPEDRIENWQCTNDECTFRIKGMTDLGLKIVERQSPDKIVMASHGKVPFDFILNIHIQGTGTDLSTAYIHFDGKINPFMEMMVGKPLSNFFNMLVKKLTELSLA